MYTIEITIPVLNEQATLIRQTDTLFEFLSLQPQPLQAATVILADNGSTDETPTMALDLCRKYPRLQYLRLDKKGVGGALKKSWGNSSADIVGYMDLDFSTDLSHLVEMTRIFQDDPGVDLVNGSRLLPGSLVRKRPLVRRFTSLTFNRLVRIIFGTRFSDGMCGFKFARRERIDRIFSEEIENDDWFFSTALLILAEKKGLVIREIALRWTDDPHSKVRIIPLALSYLHSIYRLRKQLNGYGTP
jgi:glycosyltransferase involved in cell wall biosynthesis